MKQVERIRTAVETDVQSHLATWKSSNSDLEWDKIVVQFVDEHDVVARAFRYPTGMTFIQIGRPFVRDLVSIHLSWCKRSGLSNRIEGNAESLAKFLTQASIGVVYYHEMAHVVRGHLYEMARLTGGLSADFCWDETNDPPTRGKIRLRKWLERDADIQGADFFAIFNSLKHWRGADQDSRRMLARLCLAGAGVVLMHSGGFENAEIRQAGGHDEPFLRWLRYIDALGGALYRELRMSEKPFFTAVRSALMDLADVAAHEGVPAGLWGIEDLAGFKRVLNRHIRLVSRCQTRMEELLDGRYSFLPSVGRSAKAIRDKVRGVRSARSRIEEHLTMSLSRGFTLAGSKTRKERS